MGVRRLVLLIAGPLALGPGAVALADGTGLKVGPGSLTAHLALEESYDSNMFLGSGKYFGTDYAGSAPLSSTVYASTITRLAPGVAWRVEGPRTQALLSYDLSYLAYAKFPKTNNALEHTLYGSVHHEPWEGGRIQVEDLLKAPTTDPASSELTERAKRTQNDAAVGVELPITAKTYGAVMMTDTLMKYSATGYADLLDRNEILGGVRAGVKLTAKTRAYAFYRFQSVKYETNYSYNSGGALVGAGVEGELTSRVTGTAELGSMARHYTRTRTGSTSDLTLPRYQLGLAWAAPGDWKVGLTGARQFVESVFVQDRFYVSNTLGLTVGKVLTRRLDLGALVSWGLDDYPDAAPLEGVATKRKDTMVQAGVTAAFAVRDDTKASLRWLLRTRSSNFGANDYTDTVVSAALDYRP